MQTTHWPLIVTILTIGGMILLWYIDLVPSAYKVIISVMLVLRLFESSAAYFRLRRYFRENPPPAIGRVEPAEIEKPNDNHLSVT